MGLLPALAYFLLIYAKGTLTMADGAVLAAIYGFLPVVPEPSAAQGAEGIEELDGLPRW